MPPEYPREKVSCVNFSLACLTGPALCLIQISVSNPVPPLLISDCRALFQLLSSSVWRRLSRQQVPMDGPLDKYRATQCRFTDTKRRNPVAPFLYSFFSFIGIISKKTKRVLVSIPMALYHPKQTANPQWMAYLLKGFSLPRNSHREDDSETTPLACSSVGLVVPP